MEQLGTCRSAEVDHHLESSSWELVESEGTLVQAGLGQILRPDHVPIVRRLMTGEVHERQAWSIHTNQSAQQTPGNRMPNQITLDVQVGLIHLGYPGMEIKNMDPDCQSPFSAEHHRPAENRENDILRRALSLSQTRARLAESCLESVESSLRRKMSSVFSERTKFQKDVSELEALVSFLECELAEESSAARSVASPFWKSRHAVHSKGQGHVVPGNLDFLCNSEMEGKEALVELTEAQQNLRQAKVQLESRNVVIDLLEGVSPYLLDVSAGHSSEAVPVLAPVEESNSSPKEDGNDVHHEGANDAECEDRLKTRVAVAERTALAGLQGWEAEKGKSAYLQQCLQGACHTIKQYEWEIQHARHQISELRRKSGQHKGGNQRNDYNGRLLAGYDSKALSSTASWVANSGIVGRMGTFFFLLLQQSPALFLGTQLVSTLWKLLRRNFLAPLRTIGRSPNKLKGLEEGKNQTMNSAIDEVEANVCPSSENGCKASLAATEEPWHMALFIELVMVAQDF